MIDTLLKCCVQSLPNFSFKKSFVTKIKQVIPKFFDSFNIIIICAKKKK